jgi:hypothetical protein
MASDDKDVPTLSPEALAFRTEREELVTSGLTASIVCVDLVALVVGHAHEAAAAAAIGSASTAVARSADDRGDPIAASTESAPAAGAVA